MKLLILTQKVDEQDPVLGFFHRWIIEFSQQVESLMVICLYEGKHTLPENVKVYSLGKEHDRSRLMFLIRFYKYIFSFRNQYDSVFVHMNPIYVLLGGLPWRLWEKRVSLWYVHRQKNITLWCAEKFVHHVLTSVPESFTIKSKKVSYLGHGIDTKQFECANRANSLSQPLNLIAVGRITPIKYLDVIIASIALLKEKGIPAFSYFIGAATVPNDEIYLKRVVDLARSKGLTADDYSLTGHSVSHVEMPTHYCSADININAAPTGGLDKAVLEGMASGAVPLVSNEAFRPFFGKYADDLVFKQGDPESLAKRIESLTQRTDFLELRMFLVNVAKEQFDISVLSRRILNVIKN